MSEETKNCPACGEEILATAKKCKHCGEWLDKSAAPSDVCVKELPAEYRKFNWGAFLLSWIWGIGNKTYIAFLIFAFSLVNIIPFVGWIAPFGFCIWLGIKGNELAWKNREWKSLEDFDEIQRKWAMWGGIIAGVSIVLSVVFLFFAMVILAAGEAYD